MDNIYNESDYADINSKLPQNNINKQFDEIDIKKRNFGFLKFIGLIILFILVLILIIVAITSNSNISSTEQKIKEKEEEKNSNNKILLEKKEIFNNLELNNKELENKLSKVKKDKETMDENMKLFINGNDNLENDIKTLEKDVEKLQEEIKVYEGYQKSELQIEYENLVEKIERLRQRPM